MARTLGRTYGDDSARLGWRAIGCGDSPDGARESCRSSIVNAQLIRWVMPGPRPGALDRTARTAETGAASGLFLAQKTLWAVWVLSCGISAPAWRSDRIPFLDLCANQPDSGMQHLPHEGIQSRVSVPRPSLQVPAVLESCGLAAHREVQRASDFAVKGAGREPPGDAF